MVDNLFFFGGDKWYSKKDNTLNFVTGVSLIRYLVGRSEINLIEANIFLFASLACYLRRKHKWLWLEITSLIGICLLVPFLVLNGAWFENTVVKLGVPVFVSFFYYRAFKSSKKDNQCQKRSKK